MISSPTPARQIRKLIERGTRLPLATRNYPSRGQTAVQDLFQTSEGKLFLKKSSKQNHLDCQIKIEAGTLAEREYWSYRLANRLGLHVPALWLLDQWTTVQRWLDIPDGHIYATSQGKLELKGDNVFDCALFDWLTGQIDRHDANYLYNFVDREIILIDSAYCFLKYSGSIPDYLKYFEVGFPKELKTRRDTDRLKKIRSLSQKDLSKSVPLRNGEEQSALVNRWDQLKVVRHLQDIIDLYRGGRK